MFKIAAMGDKDSIYGFAGIGLDVIPVSEPRDAVRFLRDTELDRKIPPCE